MCKLRTFIEPGQMVRALPSVCRELATTAGSAEVSIALARNDKFQGNIAPAIPEVYFLIPPEQGSAMVEALSVIDVTFLKLCKLTYDRKNGYQLADVANGIPSALHDRLLDFLAGANLQRTEEPTKPPLGPIHRDPELTGQGPRDPMG